jgi:hypothetical protein
MKLLASICNKNRAQGAKLPGVYLFEIDPDRQEARPVVLEHPRLQPVKGITGLAHFDGGILAVLQGAGQLALLDHDYRVRALWIVPALKHGHSISVAGGKAYIASTGNDSVVEFDPRAGGKVCWRDNSRGDDTIHLNSVVHAGGELYATAFGPKADGLWSSAKNGYLIHIASGRKIVFPLFHPHTALAPAGEFFFCESSRMAVGRQNGERLAVNLGYTRGLVLTETRLHVGISKGRTESVSTGQKVENASVPRVKASRCAVLSYQRHADLSKSELLSQVCLQDYGDEIYDLLPLAA